MSEQQLNELGIGDISHGLGAVAGGLTGAAEKFGQGFKRGRAFVKGGKAGANATGTADVRNNKQANWISSSPNNKILSDIVAKVNQLPIDDLEKVKRVLLSAIRGSTLFQQDPESWTGSTPANDRLIKEIVRDMYKLTRGDLDQLHTYLVGRYRTSRNAQAISPVPIAPGPELSKPKIRVKAGSGPTPTNHPEPGQSAPDPEEPQANAEPTQAEEPALAPGATLIFGRNKYEWLGSQWAEVSPSTGKAGKIVTKDMNSKLIFLSKLQANGEPVAPNEALHPGNRIVFGVIQYEWLGNQWAEINRQTGKPGKLASRAMSEKLNWLSTMPGALETEAPVSETYSKFLGREL